MRKSWLVIAAVLSAFMLVGLVPTAFAGPGGHFSVRLNNATIPWIFPPPVGLSSFCPEIPAGVNINPDDLGSGRLKQANVVERPDGTKHVVLTDLIKGTASDNFGASYKFVYENNTTLDFDGATVNVAMKDTFKLKGGDVNFTVGFNWRWAYATDSLEVEASATDIAVNPFPFATNDGVNENPDIVPGSWQKVSTRGDPINCDPL